MKRRHFFEWEDQPWLPNVLRDFITDHLQYAMHRGKIFDPAVPLLHRALAAMGETQIVDLCSGGGGPYPELARKIQQDTGVPVHVTLTDLFPNADAITRIEAKSGGQVSYRSESTSAFDVPAELTGVRTMYAALHHFRPEDARRLLADAAAKRRAIGAFEPLERDFKSMFRMGLLAIISGFLITHRVGPLTLSRALLTYVLPIAPLLFAWDSVVSSFRTYSPEELRAMTAGLGGDGYSWDIGQLDVQTRVGPFKVTYVLGMPRSNKQPTAP